MESQKDFPSNWSQITLIQKIICHYYKLFHKDVDGKKSKLHWVNISTTLNEQFNIQISEKSLKKKRVRIICILIIVFLLPYIIESIFF